MRLLFFLLFDVLVLVCCRPACGIIECGESCAVSIDTHSGLFLMIIGEPDTLMLLACPLVGGEASDGKAVAFVCVDSKHFFSSSLTPRVCVPHTQWAEREKRIAHTRRKTFDAFLILMRA